MRIAILTQSLCQNYGGLLQNYALQQVLLNAGHSPITIDHERRHRLFSFYSRFVRSLLYIRYSCFPKKYKKPKYLPNAHEMAMIAYHTQRFIDYHIFHTDKYDTHKDFKKLANKKVFQAYIVGSDQCWRPKYNRSFLKEMFLSFAERQQGIKRIAYAASFGTDKWEMTPVETKEFSRLIKKFDLITVREDTGVALCKDYLGVEAVHVLDPTLLLLKDDYIRLLNLDRTPQCKGNLFYYILDPTPFKDKFIKDLSKKKNLTPFTVLPKYQSENRKESDIKRHLEDCMYPPVTTWLRSFMDAEMIVVDSFHGMVFSIIFNKPFFVVGNEKRGMSRFTSLLKMFDLQSRLVDEHNYEKLNVDLAIDWDYINLLKDKHIKNSLALLYGSLNN